MDIINSEHTVLLVDDEENTLRALKRLLLDTEYTVITASSGAEGLALLDAHEVSVIVSDQRMPEMNGSEFLKRARDKAPDATRILLTGYSDISDTIDAINRGAIYKFASKPIDEGDLKRTLHEAVERYCLIKENNRLSRELKQQNANLEALVKEQSHDLAERKRAEESLRQATERLTLAAKAGGVGLWDYDVVSSRLEWDDQMFHLYGITRLQFAGVYEAWKSKVHPEDLQRWDSEIQMALCGEKNYDTEFRVVSPDGAIRNIRALAIVQRDTSGQVLHMVGTNWDITEQKQKEDALIESREILAHQATHDPLTGLLNRRAILDRLREEISRAGRFGELLAVGMCDIDFFKQVNDTHGHQTGDEVLCGLAQLLSKNLRVYDSVGRIGGEEFLVITPLKARNDCISIFDRLCVRVAESRIATRAGGLSVTVSIGVSCAAAGSTVNELLAAADATLYRAKSEGRNQAAYDDQCILEEKHA